MRRPTSFIVMITFIIFVFGHLLRSIYIRKKNNRFLTLGERGWSSRRHAGYPCTIACPHPCETPPPGPTSPPVCTARPKKVNHTQRHNECCGKLRTVNKIPAPLPQRPARHQLCMAAYSSRTSKRVQLTKRGETRKSRNLFYVCNGGMMAVQREVPRTHQSVPAPRGEHYNSTW